jgi:oligopeptide transport system substrate-binding protein
MIFVPYQNYHGRRTGNVRRVEMSRIESWRAALQRYDANLLDILGLDLTHGNPEEVDRVRRSHAQEYDTQPSIETIYLAFGVTLSPFDDPRVRQALAYAVDREALATVTAGAYLLPATGGLIPPGMPGHMTGIALPYDPERGRQLLAEAGYPDGAGFPDIEFLVPAGLQAQAPYLQAEWRENLGVEIQWNLLDWVELVNRLRTSTPHLIGLGWIADYPDADSYLRVAVKRHTAWRYEPYLSLVEQARQVMDQEKRLKLYAQAEQILVEQMPILPLMYGRQHRLVKPWVRRPPGFFAGNLFWKDVIIEPH